MTIEGVVFEAIPEGHEDDRRKLYAPFNADVRGLNGAQQVKVIEVNAGEDVPLAGHHHDYGELFFVINRDGCVTFTLTDRDGQTRTYALEYGMRLLVPVNVWHTAVATHGTILIGMTERAYLSPAENDRKDWPPTG